jgi:hypothetical protein
MSAPEHLLVAGTGPTTDRAACSLPEATEPLCVVFARYTHGCDP